MATDTRQHEKARQGAGDSGRYFRYMTEFVNFTAEDARAIRESALVIEKHIPSIVSDFYAHLLRYPITRKYFLKPDGSLDEDYLQKRMQHLSNFWRRTAGGEYDDEYARYVDYVGRAHTSLGADPTIYIAERYVIGQVGLMQHAISQALVKELHELDPELERRTVPAWNKLMMVILEMLARAYGTEREAETYDPRLPVDDRAVHGLAVESYERGLGLKRPEATLDVPIALADEIPEGERRIFQVGSLSIGVFHHDGGWYALHNHCLHRGGPVAAGCLEGSTLICPWHGFQYEVTSGRLLVDPAQKLDTYPIHNLGGQLMITVPISSLVSQPPAEASPGAAAPDPGRAAGAPPAAGPAAESAAPDPEAPPGMEAPPAPALAPNEFTAAELAPGQTRLVQVDGIDVAVYNIAGQLYATANACTHAGGPLHEGELDGNTVICPWHASCFDVTDGRVVCGPAKEAVAVYRVSVVNGIASVVK